MKIYTKTGDDGTTGLFTGERRSKADALFEALGTVDELNCAIGLALARMESGSRSVIIDVQSRLFDIGAVLATPGATKAKVERTKVTDADVEILERGIDEAMARVPPLKTFVLPGGHFGAAELHFARAVCRRAERLVVGLEGVDPTVARYLNRLSDYLFALALSVDKDHTPWIPRK
jgi:cob(I)alamin adenosyltransferase